MIFAGGQRGPLSPGSSPSDGDSRGAGKPSSYQDHQGTERFDPRDAAAEGEDHFRGRSPVGQMPGPGVIAFYPIEAEVSMKEIIAMDWETLIPGHSGAGGRLGTKQDAKEQLAFFQDGLWVRGT
jgi:hypothetical protein